MTRHDLAEEIAIEHAIWARRDGQTARSILDELGVDRRRYGWDNVIDELAAWWLQNGEQNGRGRKATSAGSARERR